MPIYFDEDWMDDNDAANLIYDLELQNFDTSVEEEKVIIGRGEIIA